MMFCLELVTPEKITNNLVEFFTKEQTHVKFSQFLDSLDTPAITSFGQISAYCTEKD